PLLEDDVVVRAAELPRRAKLPVAHPAARADEVLFDDDVHLRVGDVRQELGEGGLLEVALDRDPLRVRAVLAEVQLLLRVIRHVGQMDRRWFAARIALHSVLGPFGPDSSRIRRVTGPENSGPNPAEL